jgi:hypothetical protein
MSSLERTAGGRPASARNHDGHLINDDPLFVLGSTPIFTRKVNSAPYHLAPIYQGSVRRGFLDHGSAMIELLSLNERLLLLRDLFRAVRVGSRLDVVDEVKLMIAQTLDQSKLPADVIRDELIEAIRISNNVPRIKPRNIAALIEVAEMTIPYIPPTDETIAAVENTFSQTIAAVEQNGGSQLRRGVETWKTNMIKA